MGTCPQARSHVFMVKGSVDSVPLALGAPLSPSAGEWIAGARIHIAIPTWGFPQLGVLFWGSP